MFHKKTFLLLWLSGCLLATPSYAGSLKKASKRPRKASARFNLFSRRTAQKPGLVSKYRELRRLNAEAELAFNKALTAQQRTSARPLLTGPVKRRKGITRISLLRAKRMYPDKPELQHPILGSQLAEAHFLIESNRLFIEHLREMEKFWPKFMEAIPRFYKEAEALERELKEKEIKLETSEEIANWTAQQIPADTKNLFIGEIHDQHEIPQFVSQLLPLLYNKNKGRQILLFTEFLLDPEISGQNAIDFMSYFPRKHYYDPVWEKVRHRRIPIIGLESSRVQNIYPVGIADAKGNVGYYPAGAAPEGMRLRNAHWQRVLKYYRAKYPNALFIIYTGSAHSYYNFPNSLTKYLPKKRTFMLEVTLEKLVFDGEVDYKTDNLEILNPRLSFPQPVLKWKSPDLIELSGFDMRVKLPATPKPPQLKEQDMLPFQQFNLDSNHVNPGFLLK